MKQVKPHVAAASVTAAAQRVSNGAAQLALELVGYDQDLTAAMQYVFGSAFVCKVRTGLLHSSCTNLTVSICCSRHVNVAFKKANAVCCCLECSGWQYVGDVLLNSVVVQCFCKRLLYAQDSSTAKALAFHKEVRTRCITLEGDDFNPGGLLTGAHPHPPLCHMPFHYATVLTLHRCPTFA